MEGDSRVVGVGVKEGRMGEARLMSTDDMIDDGVMYCVG